MWPKYSKNNLLTLDDCEQCRCFIQWPKYPLGGGTKTFCGYWILTQGKPKKVELTKLKECPKKEEVKEG